MEMMAVKVSRDQPKKGFPCGMTLHRFGMTLQEKQRVVQTRLVAICAACVERRWPAPEKWPALGMTLEIAKVSLKTTLAKTLVEGSFRRQPSRLILWELGFARLVHAPRRNKGKSIPYRRKCMEIRPAAAELVPRSLEGPLVLQPCVQRRKWCNRRSSPPLVR